MSWNWSKTEIIKIARQELSNEELLAQIEQPELLNLDLVYLTD